MNNETNNPKVTTLAKVLELDDKDSFSHRYEAGELITFLYFEDEMENEDEELYVFVNADGVEQILYEKEFEWVTE